MQTEDALLPLSERVYHFLDIYVSMAIDVHQRQPKLLLAWHGRSQVCF